MIQTGIHKQPDVTTKVAIGICTFRRPALANTLQSLAAQTLPPNAECCVIVADNDDSPSAKPLVENAQTSAPLALHYVHAPSRNISLARNALLDKARELGADFLAMIDDDEIATPDWARHLLEEISISDADVVLGKVNAVYRPGTAEWLQRVRPHDAAPVIQRDGRILTGYAGNAMLRLGSPFLQGRRFDLSLGITGGEDDDFFRSMVRDGGTISYAPEAVAFEDVPPARESLKYLMLRKFRTGQTYGMITEPDRRGSLGVVQFSQAAAKTTALLAWAGLNALSPERRMSALLRASLHAGVCSHILGRKTLELYKS
jgi:succinoglycan biosynthesis protein ExoM